MIRRRWSGLMVVTMFAWAVLAWAQGGTPDVAFVNSSGQLVVASGDGLARWIVTNPGESLAQPLGFTWSPDGRLFFAVSSGGVASLRVGDVASQSALEIGQASGALSGGQWTRDGRGVLLGVDNALVLYPADGGSPQPLYTGSGPISAISPFANDRPHLPAAQSLSRDGDFVFFWEREGSQGRYAILDMNTGAVTALPATNDANARQSGLWEREGSQGRYAVLDMNTGAVTALSATNDANARQSGLWADSGPVVAYWGFDGGSSVLAVTHAPNGQTVSLNSGRTTPVAPVAWRPGALQLIYRDTTDFVRIADLACLAGGCGSNPLDSGVELMPATASDIQFGGGPDWVFFRDGEQVMALNLDCVPSRNCPNSGVRLGDRAAQRTWIHAAGDTLVYTAYTRDAANPNDREVRVVDLNCLRDPATCQPVTQLSQSVGGLASPDGAYIMVDQAGNGLNVLQIPDGQLTYLSGALSGPLGSGLIFARWG